MHFLKEGQKIRAWVDPPLIRAMPERKRFFSMDLFPKIMALCGGRKKKRINFLCGSPTHSKDTFILHNVSFETL